MAFFKNAFNFGIPGLFKDQFGKGAGGNAAGIAMQHFNNIGPMASQTLFPYMTRGTQGEQNAQNTYRNMERMYRDMPDLYYNPNADYNEATTQYGKMNRNPSEFLDQIMKGYEPSTGYKYKEGRMTQGMRNSAASGGFAGTELDRTEQADAIRGMLGQDMQEFLQNVLGIQGAGSAGLERMQGGRERGQERRYMGMERGLANQGMGYENQAARGYDAAKTFADIMSGLHSQQAGAAFQGQRERDARSNEARERRNKFYNNLAGAFFGGMG